jgi:hypothetical protein
MWSALRIPTAVFSASRQEPLLFLPSSSSIALGPGGSNMFFLLNFGNSSTEDGFNKFLPNSGNHKLDYLLLRWKNRFFQNPSNCKVLCCRKPQPTEQSSSISRFYIPLVVYLMTKP